MTGILAIVTSNAIISAVLALVTVAVTRFWRSPQLAHGLWLLVLLKLITPPLITVSPPSDWLAVSPRPLEPSPRATVGVGDEVASGKVHSPGELDTHEAASTAPIDSAPVNTPVAAMAHGEHEARDASASDVVPPPGLVDHAVGFASANWLTAAGVIWIAGAIVYLGLFVWRCVCFRRVLDTSAEPGIDVSESAIRLASKLGLRRSPRLRVVDAPIPPLVWSLGLRPVVVLPSRLLAELTPAQRDALVAHELAHVRRRDYLVRWLEVFALVLWWWNPLAWFARRMLREAEEECCDSWVVWALPDERRSYGEAMLATIEFLTDGPKLPALAESTFGTSFYKRRIEMIMKRNMNCKISWMALGMIVLLAMTALPIVAQTSATAESDVQPADASAAADASATAETDATVDTAESALQAIGNGVGSSSDAAAQADKSPGEEGGQAPSTEAILKRINQLEQLLQRLANERGATDPRRLAGEAEGGGARAASATSPRLPVFNVSPDEAEQKLQERLLTLDVAAAEEEVKQARISLARSVAVNKSTPRAVASIDMESQRAALRSKEIQLQRAETVLELFKKQAQRKRDEAVRWRRWPSEQSSNGQPRNRQLTEARLRAERAEAFARFKVLNQQAADEVLRLEKLLKESPDSPETWQAVEQFLKTYRNVPEQDAKSDLNRQRFPGGFSN
jgi:bla regulator protein BlaR1